MSRRFRPDDPLLLACRDLSREMDLFDAAAARALGLGRNDLRALNLLEHGPLSAATIADRLDLTRAGVTALIDRLESQDYVARTSDPTDRRVVLVELRLATWTAFATIYRPLGRQVHRAAAQLGAAELEHLTAALDRVAAAFSRSRAQLAPPAD